MVRKSVCDDEMKLSPRSSGFSERVLLLNRSIGWLLTYPFPSRHFRRWFSFLPRWICWFPGGYIPLFTGFYKTVNLRCILFKSWIVLGLFGFHRRQGRLCCYGHPIHWMRFRWYFLSWRGMGCQSECGEQKPINESPTLRCSIFQIVFCEKS